MSNIAMDSDNNNQKIWITKSEFNEVDKEKSLKESEQYNVDLESALKLAGFGPYHFALIAVAGITFLTCGLQNNLNAYILPSAQCDLSLSSNEMGLLNAIFLAGGMTSGFIWGVVVDIIGRKKSLVTGMLVDGLLTLVSSTSQNFYVLLLFRFCNGFVIGGPAAVSVMYLSEFCAEKIRTVIICYVGFFWTLSWIIMPALAWVIIPLDFSLNMGGFVYNSWRLLIAIISIPSLLCGLALLFFPESPKWLVAQGRTQEARDILASVYAHNYKLPLDGYPVKSLCSEKKKPENNDDNATVSCCKEMVKILQQGESLFVMPTLKATTLACSLFFANMFGYYGLGLWLPELFNRFEAHYNKHPDVLASVCELKPALPDEVTHCNMTHIDDAVFSNSIIIGFVCLFGNLLSGVLAGRVRRRTMPIILQSLSSLSVVAIYFLTNSKEILMVSAVFQLCVGTANLVFNSVLVDLFPPDVSGLGFCLGILSGRLGAMVSNLILGHLLDISCSTPFLLVAAILAAGGLLSFTIPDKPYADEKSSAVKNGDNTMR